MIEQQINQLFLYADEEYDALSGFMLDYVIIKKELTAEDGYSFGLFSSNFQYMTRCIRDVRYTEMKKIYEDDISISKRYLEFFGKYSDLLPFLYQKYDDYISKIEPMKLLEMAAYRGGLSYITPYYMLSETERKTQLENNQTNYKNIVKKLQKFKICQQN